MNPEHQASILRVAVGESISPLRLPDTEAAELSRWAMKRNLALAFNAAIERGDIAVSNSIAERVRRQTVAVTMASLRTRAIHRRATEALRAGAIPCLTIKGLVTSRLDYPNPALRQYGDVDVLVRPRDAERARRTLEQAGFVRRSPEPQSWTHMGHATAFRYEDEAEVDLHHHLARFAPGRLLDGLDLFDEAEPFTIDSDQGLAPHRAHRLVIAAANYSFTIADQRNWTTYADLIVLSRDGEARERSLEIADGIGLGRCMRSALVVAHETALLPVPPLSAAPADRRDRLVAWAHDKVVPVPWRERTVFAVLYPTAATLSLVGWLMPGDEYLASNGQTHLRYLRSKAEQKLLRRGPSTSA